MKRAGLRRGGWGRMGLASAALPLALALSAGLGSFAIGAWAAPVQSHRGAVAASNSPPVTPQLATYAGVTASGKPTSVAQQPFGLSVSGRYTFVADPINHAVRLLVDNNEIVFTGNGSLATEGDGTDLARTQLVGPYSVAVGNVTRNGPFQVTGFDVYIADTFANEIRKVRVAINPVGDPTAFKKVQVCTVAGSGTANFTPDGDTTAIGQATFKSPYGLAWDDLPNHDLLYVADTANNRIRVITDPNVITTPLTGVGAVNPPDACKDQPMSIRTLALPTALNHPRGLAVDNCGRLYIADTYNNVIRVYDAGYAATASCPARTPGLSLLAGSANGVAGYSGDGQLAVHALLSQPAGVAVDAQGNVFIADSGNHVIREVGPDNVIHTVAGTPQQPTKPGTSAGDGGAATHATLLSPMAVAVRPNGDVVIADTGDNAVRILEAKVSSGSSHNIHLEAGTGAPSFSGDGGPAAAAQFSAPAAVLSQMDRQPVNAAVPLVTGTRYVLDTFNQVVRRYHSADQDPQPSADGDADDVSTFAGLGGMPGGADQPDLSQPGSDLSKARFANPMGMALSGNTLYIADTFNNVVRQLDLSNRTLSIFAGTPGKPGYDGDTHAARNAHLSYPTGLAVDNAGDVFIADSYNGVVREVVNGNIYTVAGTGELGYSGDGGAATSAGLYFPYGVAVDSSTPPNLFIADSFDHRIRRVDAVSPLDSNKKVLDPRAKNTITTVAGDGMEFFGDGPTLGPTSLAPVLTAPSPTSPPVSAEFARPWGVTLNQGNLLVADYLNNRIRQIDLGAQTVTTVAGNGGSGLLNAGAPDGLPPDSGPALRGELNGPKAISSLGDTGALLLADSFNNRVRWYGLTQQGIQRTQVNFDTTNLSSSSLPQSVSISSTGTGLLVLGQVALTGDNMQDFFLDPQRNTCGEARLEAGSSCYFQVQFRPRSLGPRSGAVQVPNDAIGAAQFVALNGQATAPLVTLTPPSVAIYQPLSGTPATPVRVSLTNNGSGVLEIRQIRVVDGTDASENRPSSFFSQSNDCPTLMQAGTSCTLTISLNPLQGSDQTAKIGTLIVQDDAAGNPVTTQIVPLTGGIATPLAALDHQDLAFAQNIGTASPPQTFTLVNSGQVPLHLSQIREDGDFSQTNNCPPVLAPGASCAIAVTFVPSTLGERDGYIVIADDSPNSPQRIAVTGQATIPSAQLGPSRLTFSANVGANAPSQLVGLINHGDGPLTIGAIGTTGDFRAQPNCPAVLLPGTSCSIGITFAPQASGTRQGSLVITDDSNGVIGSQQSVLLSGMAYQPVASLSAASISPGINLGGSVSQSIGVTNTGDGPLTIRGLGISGGASGDYAQASTCLRTLQPGASCSISISFTPHAYGARNATLTIYDDAAGGGQTVALRGVGTQPRPVLSGSFLNFYGQAVGTPGAPQSIVLFNAGNGPLSVSSVNVSGPDFIMGTTCGPSLGAGASCRITVTFVPQGRGPRSGVVSIVDAAGTQRFTLSGVGT